MMKREIKFRAFQDNQMLTMPLSNVYGLSRFLGMLYEDTKLMQYTGLKDKNGKEVYEGDVLFVEQWKRKGVVIFRSGMFQLDYKQDPEHRLSLITVCNHEIECEIIGNICENTNLLTTTNE